MQVERVKYIIWAADVDRALHFYTNVLGAEVTRKSAESTKVMAEVEEQARYGWLIIVARQV